MRRFRSGVAVLSLCAAMLIGAGKGAAIRHHSRAVLDDDVITAIINALVNLESRMSIPPA